MAKIEKMLDDFQKKFGIRFKKPEHVKAISTSVDLLDKGLHIGGFPEGKIIEIAGEAGVGKTALSYKFIKEAQAQNKSILYVDAYKSFSHDFACKLGVKLDQLIVCDAPSGESVFTIIAYYLARNLVDVVILDSLASLVSEEEIEKQKGDYLQQAHMIERLLQILLPEIDKKKVTMVCLNEIRMNLDTKKLQTPFDSTMAYYSSIRIMLTKLKSIKKDRILLGHLIEAKIYKNNFGKLDTVNFELFT